MTEIFNEIIYKFGSYSALKTIVSYEKKREGANMLYRFNYKIFISDRNGNPYAYGNYNNKLKAEFTLNGVKVWEKETSSTSAGWSFEYTSDWFTVKDKTTGTTPFKFTIKDTINSGWCNYTSSTFNLDIDAAGSDLGAVANFNIGTPFNVGITKYTSMYDVLKIKIGNTEIKTINDASSSNTINFTTDELDDIYDLTTTVQSTVFTFELVTYEDNTKATQVGTTKTTTARGYIIASNPLIESIVAIDTNSKTVALTGDNSKMVRYESNVEVTVSACGVNKANIKSIVINDVTAQDGIVTFGSAVKNTFSVVVTDSRGFVTTDSITLETIPYIPLTINATIKRNQTTDGKVVINYSGNYFNGSFGNVKNNLTVSYRYKEKGGSFSEWISLSPTLSSNTYSQSATIEGFDYQKQFEFEVKAEDKLNIEPVTGIPLPKGEAILYWKENKVGVNGDFEVKSDKSIKSGRYIESNHIEAFQSGVFGSYNNGYRLKAIRSAISGNSDYPQYSSGMAWTGNDTHGFILTKYNSADVIVGGGNSDAIKWVKHMAFKDDISTLETNINNLKETVLYNNTTGSTGNITLSQSSANFSYLEIFFKDNNLSCGSVKVYSPNEKQVDLFLGQSYLSSNTNHSQFMFRQVEIKGTAINNLNVGFVLIAGTQVAQNNTNNYIHITRVVGYK